MRRCSWPTAGLDFALVEHALGLGFAGVMVDTADKRAEQPVRPAAGRRREALRRSSAPQLRQRHGRRGGRAAAARRYSAAAAALRLRLRSGLHSAVTAEEELSACVSSSAPRCCELAASMRDAAQAYDRAVPRPAAANARASSVRAEATSIRRRRRRAKVMKRLVQHARRARSSSVAPGSIAQLFTTSMRSALNLRQVERDAVAAVVPDWCGATALSAQPVHRQPDRGAAAVQHARAPRT